MTINQEQCVYFIKEAGGGDRCRVKIGWTTQATRKRLANLQTAHHRELKIVRLLRGCKEDEATLHRHYKSHRLRGEWFRFTAGMLTEDLGLPDLPIPPVRRPLPALSPDQNRTVVRWINAHAKRPRISAELWAEFFCHMRMDTGEIVMTRQEMAAAASTTLNNVSSALSELAAVGALIRHQDGRAVQWFMNPKIGTCLTGKAREDAQQAAPKLKLAE